MIPSEKTVAEHAKDASDDADDNIEQSSSGESEIDDDACDTSAVDVQEPALILLEKTDEWLKVTLPPVLTIANVHHLKAELNPCTSKRVQIVGTQVERIDTASLQLLTALICHPDVTISWVEVSPALYDAAVLLGLEQYLSLDES